MGDVISLVERAQQTFDEEEARKINQKIRKNQFGFDDFLNQLQQIKKMGNLKDLMGMIPGMGKAIKDLDIDDDSFKPVEAIIRSMTPYERENPDSIDGSRRKRIANGSGRSGSGLQPPWLPRDALLRSERPCFRSSVRVVEPGSKSFASIARLA